MQVQETLEGKQVWNGVCCEACWFAKEEKCVCKCGGANHGKGRYIQERQHEDPILPFRLAEPFFKQMTRPNCLCGWDLSNEPISYYENHSGGWKVEGFNTKLWLYIVCPKCGYQMALWKMGVLREA